MKYSPTFYSMHLNGKSTYGMEIVHISYGEQEYVI